MHQLEFKVTGMVCAGCSTAVRNVVTALPGVDMARVDHETGTASVRHDEAISSDAIFGAIREAGFDILTDDSER